MFKKLGDTLKAKFSRQDNLSRQLLIVKVFDLYQNETGLRPKSLKNRVLTVVTQSPVEANELRFREHELVKKINRELGRPVVERIVYRF